MSESLIVRPVIQGEYFGTKSFGRIFGITGIFSTVGGLVAPVVAGWVVDTYHVYQSIWLTMVGFGLVTAVLVLTIRPIRDMTKSH